MSTTKKSTIVVKSTITVAKIKQANQSFENALQSAREAYYNTMFVDNLTIDGDISKQSEVVSAIVRKLSNNKLETRNQAVEAKPAWLSAVNKVQNFMSSWVDIEGGELVLRDTDKKLEKSGGKGKAVSFKPSNLITMLEKFNGQTGYSRKAKQLARELKKELVSK